MYNNIIASKLHIESSGTVLNTGFKPSEMKKKKIETGAGGMLP
jgi:hypothetical protein